MCPFINKPYLIDSLIIWTIFVPLINFILIGTFGKKTKNGILYTTFLLSLSALISSVHNLYLKIISSKSGLIGFLETLNNSKKVKFYHWIHVGNFKVDWTFLIDGLSLTMIVLIYFISLCVILFSIQYMKGDANFNKFFGYLNLFIFFMLFLVTSSNFITFFLGWEGVGLTSYLLISFWNLRLEAGRSALKAIIYNRVGDVAYIIAVALLFKITKTVDFSSLNNTLSVEKEKIDEIIHIGGFEVSILFLICFLFCIAAMAKSAQFGLHAWLPDAMEGPTPVSALIHAATMVTAGVYLLLRLNILFILSPSVSNLLSVLGAFTIVYAGIIAVFQYDLKKIIAYSTCSQLGYMVLACGLGNFKGAFFHLVTHAFFKAALFLSAGVLIYSLNGEQDIRKMGGLSKKLPTVFLIMLLNNLALIGLPPLAGYYSKDFIFLGIIVTPHYYGGFIIFNALIGILLTALYSTRAFYYTFFTDVRYKKLNLDYSSILFYLPLFLLTLGGIFSGYFLKPLMVENGRSFFDDCFVLSKDHQTLLFNQEFQSIFIKNLPLIFMLIGFFIFFFTCLYGYSPSFVLHTLRFNKLFIFFNQQWFFNIFVNNLTKKFLKSSGKTYLSLDRGFFEFFGPQSLSKLVDKVSKKIDKLQKGRLFRHLLYLFLWVFGLLILFSLLFYILL